MTNNIDISKMTRMERIAYFSNAREGAPIMPAVVRRPPPKARRNSVRHRAIR